MSNQVYKVPVTTLNSGRLMPLLGLGTFKVRGTDVIHRTLDTALLTGYTSFDTASVYRNERDIGKSLKELLPKYGLQRADIFITSKLGPSEQGRDQCRKACLQSIEKLQCDYLDLYLIHWPGTQGKKPEDAVNRELRLQSWQDMIQLQQEGKLKSIGVSNFLPHHISDIIKHTNVTPAVLQIEHHPHLVQTDLITYCKEKGIHFQAYSSLGTTTAENQLTSDKNVGDIAKSVGKTVAQILLKWAVQQNIGVMMDWRELWTIMTGLEPPLYHVSAAVSSLLLFAIIFTFCFTMHRLSEIIIPKFMRIYCLDFFKTLAFCTYPFGLMILRKYHGDIGYAMCSIPLNTATALLLSTGEGSPVGNWLLFVKGRQSMTKCVLRIFVQVCAGLSGFRLGKLLMNLDFHSEFKENLSQTACVTALNVSASLGMIIELLGTIWDVWFHSQNFSNNVVVDKLLKFCNSSLTFCLGGYPTGMFRDPAKAVGLTYGCSGVTPSEHILVYWIGPMIGSYIAHKIPLQNGDLQNKRTNKATSQMDSEKAKNRKRQG